MLGWLVLEYAEGIKLPLRINNGHNARGAKRAHQLILQIGFAHERPQDFCFCSAKVLAKPSAFEAAADVQFLGGVTAHMRSMR